MLAPINGMSFALRKYIDERMNEFIEKNNIT